MPFLSRTKTIQQTHDSEDMLSEVHDIVHAQEQSSDLIVIDKSRTCKHRLTFSKTTYGAIPHK